MKAKLFASVSLALALVALAPVAANARVSQACENKMEETAGIFDRVA